MNLMSLLKKKAPAEPKPKEKKVVKKPEVPVEVDLGWIKGVHYFD